MILVTGAAGIVGRAVVSNLRRRGTSIVGITRLAVASEASDHVACDLSAERLVDVMTAAPSAIIHTAAAVPHSSRYPDTAETAEMTRRMDLNVFDAAQRWHCPVVYVSTCGLYDRRSSAVKHEDGPLAAEAASPYFAAKRDGEKQCLKLAHGTVLRISAPLGPGVPDHLVASRFILQAIRGGTMRVFGKGTREQNYVDASDIATALVGAAASSWHGIVNIAASRPVTMLELAQRIAATLGGDVELADEHDSREGETARYAIDRAVNVLNWSPIVSLEDSIRAVAKAFEAPRTESIA
jgi:UDP-glucuronate decarboxylase